MSRPSKFGGRMGHSFDSEGTSVLTSPPLSPPRDSQYAHYGGGYQQHQQQQHHYAAARHSGNVGRSDFGTGAVPPMYYVQSPSRDSFTFNDHDSFSQSFAAKSSPGGSPLASPLHKSYASKSYQQQQQHQQQQQPYQDYYGGNPRPGPRRVLPQPNGVNGGAGAASGTGTGAGVGGAYPVVPPPQQHQYQHQQPHQQQPLNLKKGYQPWNVANTIQEHESYYQGSGRRGISKWCAIFLSIVFALICAVIVGFVYWLVCRPSAPKVEVKRIDFQSFSIAGGNDATGVPTQVLTVNCTAILNFGNPSKYFGFHVSAPAGQLLYEQIVVADGESHKFFQKKKSSGVISVDVHAARNPVYGAGPYLSNAYSSGEGLPLHLQLRVQSEAHVIWKMVKSKYRSNIGCDVVLNGNGTTTRTGMLKLLSQDCKHHKK